MKIHKMLNGDILKKSEAIDIDESAIHLEFKTPTKKTINMNKSHSLDHWQEKLEQYFLKAKIWPWTFTLRTAHKLSATKIKHSHWSTGHSTHL